MGCVSARADWLGGISASAINLGGVIAKSVRIGGIFTSTEYKGGISADANRTGGISARCGLVCTANFVRRLNVSKDVCWLIPENEFKDLFVVFSNVDWVIN